ncbi:Beta-galactosidase C-terminal domain [Paenibacillus sp. 2RAB27]|uniref:Beta-galactosidase C-terminal domain n=1 Tax=Paenibacillus sp. 2RAB27 TaxID=3232991 RepID=UPI003F98F910
MPGCSEAGITPILFGLPEGVEAMVRVGTDDSGRKILFVINHTEEVVTVNLDTTYTDALTDRAVSGVVVLNPQDVMVLYVQQ